MRRRTLGILAFVALVALAIGLALRARLHAVDRAEGGVAKGSTRPVDPQGWDGGPVVGTVHDRQTRDELRRRILAAWSTPAGYDAPTPRAEGQGPAPSPPGVPPRDYYGDNNELDRAYIQHVMREDLFPLARQCFGQLLERKPDAGGKVLLHFGIVGDPQLGGYVDDTAIDAGTPEDIQDPEMQTCLRESMNSIAFAPPKKGGTVTVDYPIEFSP